MMLGMHSAEIRVAIPQINNVHVSDDTLTVDLTDGRSVSVPIGWFPRLAHATQAERDTFEIAGAGYGIHWPLLDEDIGVEGLLFGKKSTESLTSLKRWLDSREK